MVRVRCKVKRAHLAGLVVQTEENLLQFECRFAMFPGAEPFTFGNGEPFTLGEASTGRAESRGERGGEERRVFDPVEDMEVRECREDEGRDYGLDR